MSRAWRHPRNKRTNQNHPMILERFWRWIFSFSKSKLRFVEKAQKESWNLATFWYIFFSFPSHKVYFMARIQFQFSAVIVLDAGIVALTILFARKGKTWPAVFLLYGCNNIIVRNYTSRIIWDVRNTFCIVDVDTEVFRGFQCDIDISMQYLHFLHY